MATRVSMQDEPAAAPCPSKPMLEMTLQQRPSKTLLCLAKHLQIINKVSQQSLQPYLATQISMHRGQVEMPRLHMGYEYCRSFVTL